MSLKQRQHPSGIWLPSAVCEGCNRKVNGVDSRINGSHIGTGSQACSIMGVDPYGNREPGFESTNNGASLGWGDEACHVFQYDRIGSHFFQLDAHFDKFFCGVDRAAGIANGTMGSRTSSFDCADCAGHIAGVIQRVKYAKDIHAMFHTALNKCCDHIVWEMRILNNVLSP